MFPTAQQRWIAWKAVPDPAGCKCSHLRLSFRCCTARRSLSDLVGRNCERFLCLRRCATGASGCRAHLHASAYLQATSALNDVLRFCMVLSEQPNASLVTPGERHWSIFESLCLQSRASGNLVQDAWFAALAIESGCEWITADRDYAKFDGLSWRAPF